jgi:hypothetical protein
VWVKLAAQKDRAIGDRVYGPFAVGVAFAFVVAQLSSKTRSASWRAHRIVPRI